MNHTSSLEKRIVPLFFFAWGLSIFNRLSISFAMPVIQADLQLSAANIGMVTFVSTIATALSATVVGYLSDKRGKRKGFLVPALLLTGIGSLFSPLATSYLLFLLCRGLVGIGVGPVLSLILAITESLSSPNKFGANTGYVMAGDALLAGILGPVLITQLLSVMSWQMALCVTGIPTVLISLWVAKMVPETTVPMTETAPISIAALFRHKNMVQCLLLSTLTMGAFFVITTYAPMLWTEVAGYSVETMGIITSVMGVIFVGYSLGIARGSDRFGRKPVMMVSCLLCVLAPLFMYLCPTSPLAVGSYIAFAGICGTIPVFFNTTIPLECLPEHLKATGATLLLAIGEVAGSAGLSLVGGYIADQAGYEAAMLFATVLLGASFCLTFTLKESNPTFL